MKEIYETTQKRHGLGEKGTKHPIKRHECCGENEEGSKSEINMVAKKKMK